MSELDKVSAALLAAYDRLIAAEKVSNGSEFKAYCDRFGLNYDGMMQAARKRVAESLNRYKLERNL